MSGVRFQSAETGARGVLRKADRRSTHGDVLVTWDDGSRGRVSGSTRLYPITDENEERLQALADRQRALMAIRDTAIAELVEVVERLRSVQVRLSGAGGEKASELLRRKEGENGASS